MAMIWWGNKNRDGTAKRDERPLGWGIQPLYVYDSISAEIKQELGGGLLSGLGLLGCDD